jgi:hypothetical protein
MNTRSSAQKRNMSWDDIMVGSDAETTIKLNRKKMKTMTDEELFMDFYERLGTSLHSCGNSNCDCLDMLFTNRNVGVRGEIFSSV